MGFLAYQQPLLPSIEIRDKTTGEKNDSDWKNSMYTCLSASAFYFIMIFVFGIVKCAKKKDIQYTFNYFFFKNKKHLGLGLQAVTKAVSW